MEENRVRHLVTSIPLWLLALLSLAGYLVLSFWFPLRPLYNRSPSPDFRGLAPSLLAALAYTLLLCLLYGLYWLAYLQIRRHTKALSLKMILLTAAVFCIPLLFTFPINATDVYRYFLRGRITSVHEQSPFSVSVAELGDEPYRSLAGEWEGETSPYGPLWELTAATVTGRAPDNLWLGLLLFKGLAALSFLVSGGLIWLGSSGVRPEKKAGMTLLWAWNPALLLIFAMDGHNDGLMILWLLLGWWFMVRGRPQLGMIFMLLAPLTKPIALIALPYLFIGCWRRLPDRISKGRFLLVTGLAGLLLVWLSFSPFGSPFTLARRLLSEAGSGGGFSPLALIILQARELGFDPSIELITTVATLLFGLLALWLVWRTWLGRSPLRAAADIFAGYIVQAFRFRLWYAAWPFPWLLLEYGQATKDEVGSAARLAAGLVFLLSSQLSVVIFGQIRSQLFAGSQLPAHWVGVLFTFLAPLIAAFAVVAYDARSREPQREI